MRHLEVRAVWMNCAMNPKHPQAKKTHKLRRVAATAMRGLAALGPGIGARAEELLSVFQINNAGAMETLRKTLLKGKEPTYVHAGQTNETHHIKLDKAKIHVLGPESDFDHFYLGKAAARTPRLGTWAKGQPPRQARSSTQSFPCPQVVGRRPPGPSYQPSGANTAPYPAHCL
jgi:hypothetical protein